MTAMLSVWKRGPEVKCARNHTIAVSGIIDHGVPICRNPTDRTHDCGRCVYMIVLSRDPLLFAYVDVTPQQRAHILHNNLTPLQALWYLRLPAPMDQSA